MFKKRRGLKYIAKKSGFFYSVEKMYSFETHMCLSYIFYTFHYYLYAYVDYRVMVESRG